MVAAFNGPSVFNTSLSFCQAAGVCLAGCDGTSSGGWRALMARCPSLPRGLGSCGTAKGSCTAQAWLRAPASDELAGSLGQAECSLAPSVRLSGADPSPLPFLPHAVGSCSNCATCVTNVQHLKPSPLPPNPTVLAEQVYAKCMSRYASMQAPLFASIGAYSGGDDFPPNSGGGYSPAPNGGGGYSPAPNGGGGYSPSPNGGDGYSPAPNGTDGYSHESGE